MHPKKIKRFENDNQDEDSSSINPTNHLNGQSSSKLKSET